MQLNPDQGIAVFTDGSASSRDRSGGWGWVALDAYGSHETHSGWEADTTISRMELFAAGSALFWLAEDIGPCEVLVFSDSEYVVKGFTDKRRKRNKNRDLWDDLEEQAERHDHVEFEHVRGHQGQKWNEMADELAGVARREGKESV